MILVIDISIHCTCPCYLNIGFEAHESILLYKLKICLKNVADIEDKQTWSSLRGTDKMAC